MTTISGNEARRSNRRQNHRRESNLKSIKIGGDVDKGRVVTVYYGIAAPIKEKSTFSWFEEFTMEWSETFIQETKNNKKGN